MVTLTSSPTLLRCFGPAVVLFAATACRPEPPPPENVDPEPFASTSSVIVQSGAGATGSSPAPSTDQVVIGTDGDDVLSGGSGNDVLIGDGPTLDPRTGEHTGDGPFIVVDQFGYRPDMRKIAVIRDPRVGYDSEDSLTPEQTYQVIDLSTGQEVFRGPATIWSNGDTDADSGDGAWWFDFSAVTTPGSYIVRDTAGALKSHRFDIRNDVYNAALRDAFRTFFYQRVGMAKTPPYADPRWADAASHIGPGQDPEARRFDATGDASTARDVSGGWYDAGDYNKYTNWTADYIIGLLLTYLERPEVWTDDFGIPESANGLPDILDEVRFGLDWLMRMQNSDGSVLSIVGLDHASPPSSATGESRYGPENTSATLTSAGAFALGAMVFDSLGDPGYSAYAADLRTRAEDAWAWADSNPNVTFRNNDSAFGSNGLGAGQQEVDDAGRTQKKLSAAIYLAAATGATEYHQHVTDNYTTSTLVGNYFIDGFRAIPQRDLLFYTSVDGADTNVVNTIIDRYQNALESNSLLGAYDSARDPYQAYMNVYTWSSNNFKARTGNLFLQAAMFDASTRTDSDLYDVGAGYLHYLHGVNPLGLVYLSNMREAGAESSVDTFYHSWFTDGSLLWDSVLTSQYGPAPGFLVGGPNPTYSWDSCCPSSCGSPGNNALCGSAELSPPVGQPPAKSYRQFNDGWPVNSWSITENHNYNQIAYLRLVSAFAEAP